MSSDLAVAVGGHAATPGHEFSKPRSSSHATEGQSSELATKIEHNKTESESKNAATPETAYEGYVLERCPIPRGSHPTWERVSQKKLRFSDETLRDMVKRYEEAYESKVATAFDNLSTSQRAAVRRLRDQRQESEKAEHIEWVLECVHRSGPMEECKKIIVILRCQATNDSASTKTRRKMLSVLSPDVVDIRDAGQDKLESVASHRKGSDLEATNDGMRTEQNYTFDDFARFTPGPSRMEIRPTPPVTLPFWNFPIDTAPLPQSCSPHFSQQFRAFGDTLRPLPDSPTTQVPLGPQMEFVPYHTQGHVITPMERIEEKPGSILEKTLVKTRDKLASERINQPSPADSTCTSLEMQIQMSFTHSNDSGYYSSASYTEPRALYDRGYHEPNDNPQMRHEDPIECDRYSRSGGLTPEILEASRVDYGDVPDISDISAWPKERELERTHAERSSAKNLDDRRRSVCKQLRNKDDSESDRTNDQARHDRGESDVLESLSTGEDPNKNRTAERDSIWTYHIEEETDRISAKPGHEHRTSCQIEMVSEIRENQDNSASASHPLAPNYTQKGQMQSSNSQDHANTENDVSVVEQLPESQSNTLQDCKSYATHELGATNCKAGAGDNGSSTGLDSTLSLFLAQEPLPSHSSTTHQVEIETMLNINTGATSPRQMTSCESPSNFGGSTPGMEEMMRDLVNRTIRLMNLTKLEEPTASDTHMVEESSSISSFGSDTQSQGYQRTAVREGSSGSTSSGQTNPSSSPGRAINERHQASHESHGSLRDRDEGEGSQRKKQRISDPDSSSPTKKRFPCIYHAGEPGIYGNHTSRYEFISEMLRHLQTHNFFPCPKCLTIFPTQEEKIFHEKQIPCRKACSNKLCRRHVPQSGGPDGVACNCIITSEDLWAAIFRLVYPYLPIPEPWPSRVQQWLVQPRNSSPEGQSRADFSQPVDHADSEIPFELRPHLGIDTQAMWPLLPVLEFDDTSKIGSSQSTQGSGQSSWNMTCSSAPLNPAAASFFPDCAMENTNQPACQEMVQDLQQQWAVLEQRCMQTRQKQSKDRLMLRLAWKRLVELGDVSVQEGGLLHETALALTPDIIEQDVSPDAPGPKNTFSVVGWNAGDAMPRDLASGMNGKERAVDGSTDCTYYFGN